MEKLDSKKEDKGNEVKEDKEEEKKEEKFDPFLELRKQLIILEKAVTEKDTKTCGVVARNYKRIREELSLKDVGLIFDHYLPDLASKLNIPRYDPELMKIDYDKKLHLSKERATKLAETIETK